MPGLGCALTTAVAASAAVGAQKMLYELLLRRKLDHEAAKASRPGWGYRHGNTRA